MLSMSFASVSSIEIWRSVCVFRTFCIKGAGAPPPLAKSCGGKRPRCPRRSRVYGPIPSCPPRVVSGAFRVHPVTLPELSNCLRGMSSSKASTEDGVTIAMLRMTFSAIGPHLTHVIKASIVSGVVPAALKIATVVPFHKSGCKEDPSNYRPISILPTVAKLAERVVCTQLLNYLIAHDVLCDQQHGFVVVSICCSILVRVSVCLKSVIYVSPRVCIHFANAVISA